MSTCWYRRITPGGTQRLVLSPVRKLNRGIVISPPLINQRQGINLRLDRWMRQRVWIVNSIRSESLSEGNCSPCLYTVEEKEKKDSLKQSIIVEEEDEKGKVDGRRKRDRDRMVEVLLAATATVIMGVGNRVLYKLALVPLKQYPFFLAQFATFGECLTVRSTDGLLVGERMSKSKTTHGFGGRRNLL